MDKVVKVTVSKSVRDLMQRVWLDYYHKKEIIRGILDDHKYDTDDSIIKSTVFKSYENQCQKCMIAYDAACKEFTNEYVPDEIKNKNYSWNLDFDTCELFITVHGEK